VVLGERVMVKDNRIEVLLVLMALLLVKIVQVPDCIEEFVDIVKLDVYA
jgi:hypothetical protein